MDFLRAVFNRNRTRPWTLSGAWEHKVGFLCITMQYNGVPDGSFLPKSWKGPDWEGEEWDS